jgi:cobalt-zinc-cadmium efflux system outer membrane protein
MMNHSSRTTPCQYHRLRSWASGPLACLLALALALPASGQGKETLGPARYTLVELSALALESNRSLAAAADLVAAARAGITTARAYPNPELEAIPGNVRARKPGVYEGGGQTATLTQPIDYPWVRRARIGAADAGFDAASSEEKLSRTELLARLQYRFYELLRQEADLKAAREDARTLEQIAGRIKLKVDTGESARFEAIKADTELLIARKVVETAELRIRQTKANLRQLVGEALPAAFEVAGDLNETAVVPTLEALNAELLTNNPELARNRAQTRQAKNLRDYEQHQRWPALAIKGAYDQSPDASFGGIGIVVKIPLWDRREGPVGEAEARLASARNQEAYREFSLQQSLEVAWQQWQIATAQVRALETGILRQATAALKVAEAAYRSGERGILEFLDAQRVYRAARNELITAHFDQQVAIIEIDRLRAAPADRVTSQGITP